MTRRSSEQAGEQDPFDAVERPRGVAQSGATAVEGYQRATTTPSYEPLRPEPQPSPSDPLDWALGNSTY